MSRILLLIILFWLLYRVLKRIAAGSEQAAKPKAKPAESIVQCTNCGLRVPESDSHISQGKVVCNNPQCSTSA